MIILTPCSVSGLFFLGATHRSECCQIRINDYALSFALGIIMVLTSALAYNFNCAFIMVFNLYLVLSALLNLFTFFTFANCSWFNLYIDGLISCVFNISILWVWALCIISRSVVSNVFKFVSALVYIDESFWKFFFFLFRLIVFSLYFNWSCFFVCLLVFIVRRIEE